MADPKEPDFQVQHGDVAATVPEVRAGSSPSSSEALDAGLDGATLSTTGGRGVPTTASGSGGFQVRCPHCRNPVELMPDAPLANIACPLCGSWFDLIDDAESTRDAQVVSRVGNFELVERLGMGAFGTVWKARDTVLDRTVAVKIPRKGYLQGEEAERFVREARAAAQLRHPNIIQIHEVGRHEDVLYLVSDYIRGLPLSEIVTDRRLTQHESADLVRKVAVALQHAHDAGVIHRDLKPSNILIDESGEPYIMDFGLAKRETCDVTMTIEGVPLGTPAYMSPEQAKGELKITDRRSDIYSLGVILFHMLTGELPFRGTSRVLLQKTINAEPPNPRSLNNCVSRDLATICLKCLEKEPAKRYGSSRELAGELGRVLRGEPIKARPVGMLERAMRWYFRHDSAAVLAAGGYATLLAVLLLCWAAVGVFFFATGIISAGRPIRAVLELAILVVCGYLPILWCGVGTLNGKKKWMWAGTFAMALGVVVAIAIMFGEPRLAQLESLAAARSSVYARFQLGTLIMVMMGGGLGMYVLAICRSVRRA